MIPIYHWYPVQFIVLISEPPAIGIKYFLKCLYWPETVPVRSNNTESDLDPRLKRISTPQKK